MTSRRNHQRQDEMLFNAIICHRLRHLSATSINQPHQSNRRTGSNASNKTHLNSTPNPGYHILASTPPTHSTSLDISKGQQRNHHHANAPVQSCHDLRGNKVWNQRDEPANEVPQCQRESRNPRLIAVWRGLAVVEGNQEFQETLVRRMQIACDIFNGCRGKTVGGENVPDHRLRFLGFVLDQLFRVADDGIV